MIIYHLLLWYHGLRIHSNQPVLWSNHLKRNDFEEWPPNLPLSDDCLVLKGNKGKISQTAISSIRCSVFPKHAPYSHSKKVLVGPSWQFHIISEYSFLKWPLHIVNHYFDLFRFYILIGVQLSLASLASLHSKPPPIFWLTSKNSCRQVRISLGIVQNHVFNHV